MVVYCENRAVTHALALHGQNAKLPLLNTVVNEVTCKFCSVNAQT
jgi:hypothetical protein